MNALDSNPRWQILLKEIELIHSNIKNLDDIIYKTKNFAILLWGGSLYLIVQHLKSVKDVNTIIFVTAVIPIIFWAMHFRWQKHLSMCAERERLISFFINSAAFNDWLDGSDKIHFPLYDVPGWLYTNKESENPPDDWHRLGVTVDQQFFLDTKRSGFWKILFYKDAKWYYSMMILISIVLGILYSSGTPAPAILMKSFGIV